MAEVMSWWVVALVVGATAPLWIRALSEHWDRKVRERTARLLARAGELDRKAGPP
jgi:hypothetical protein